ncbi:phosphate permease [Gautieria morchelliformis]|nr:phosphate permease [Gautieria morchelliformis]
MSDHASDIQKGDPAAYALDQRRRAALAEVDNAGFNRFHVKVCFVAGVGFFTDAYDLFAINIASTMLGNIYGPVTRSARTGASLAKNQDLGVKVASPVGTLCGQLLFGWLADVVGRKRMYGVELCVIIVATFGQAIAGRAHAISIIGVLVVWRFIQGVGIGGDYPLSAVISSEFASRRTRGRLMTAVFAAQGWGQFAAAIVSAICLVAFKPQIQRDTSSNPVHLDFVWRLIIGLGAVPGAVALYFRLTIPETPRFTMDIERNVRQASQDVDTFLTTGTFVVDPDAVVQRAAAPKASRQDFLNYFSKWENGKILLGTSYSWFALDIAFYGLGLNSSIILTAINFGSPPAHLTQGFAVYQNLLNLSIGNMILSVAGLIPGYYVAFLFIDSWGRKPIQLMGFIMLTIIFIIMGFGYNAILKNSSGAFTFLYCLANFFQNFGPNTTTFVIPGEAFPTRYRSTAHGISAASGKLGAIVAQVGFAQLKDIGGTNQFINHILEIFALFMLTGIFSTLLLPETKGRSLEDISNENQENFIHGVSTRGVAEETGHASSSQEKTSR